MADQRKKSVYFPADVLQELETHALRTDRPISWLVQFALKNSQDAIARLPTINDVPLVGPRAP